MLSFFTIDTFSNVCFCCSIHNYKKWKLRLFSSAIKALAITWEPTPPWFSYHLVIWHMEVHSVGHCVNSTFSAFSAFTPFSLIYTFVFWWISYSTAGFCIHFFVRKHVCTNYRINSKLWLTIMVLVFFYVTSWNKEDKLELWK